MNPALDCVDLASELLGGVTLAASDDFFAAKENLLKPAAPVFLPERYTEFGKWMDGWESRRKRIPGHDWCVIKLGLAGILRGADVDTSFFTGNFPSHCSIEACTLSNDDWKNASWMPIVAKSRLQGGSHNPFDIDDEERRTHIRLNIFPDGGVARLRVYGEVLPDLDAIARSGQPVDFASVQNGGLALTCSDMYFGSKNNLIMPGRPVNMGGGWETKRRRGPGYDWIIVRLGARCHFEKIGIETEHFKGNYPDRCSLDACDAPGALVEDLATGAVRWMEVLPATKLGPDAVHEFTSELLTPGPFSHVRLKIYPDGGISRLRVFGRLES